MLYCGECSKTKYQLYLLGCREGPREAEAVAIEMKEGCQGDSRFNAYGREEARTGQRVILVSPKPPVRL